MSLDFKSSTPNDSKTLENINLKGNPVNNKLLAKICFLSNDKTVSNEKDKFEKIKDVFNKEKNMQGQYIKFILGS